jgi:hypothetical protein
MGLFKLGYATVNLNSGNPRSDAGAPNDRTRKSNVDSYQYPETLTDEVIE